jgi:formate-dependent phosphoribosylglycinamide formyltransferase (GAR transformylase)
MATTFASCAGKTVAVLGGGQLGKMLSSAAHQLGLKVVVLDPAEDCPCHGFVDKHLVGDFKQSEEVLRLVDEKYGSICLRGSLPTNPNFNWSIVPYLRIHS